VTRTRLENGIEVLLEPIPGVRSVAAGVWVRQGAAHEAPERMGGSHLLEHMVFKGTERRSAHDIALSLESLGGSLDAYTTRESTGFTARVLDRHLDEALDVLADLVRRPLLRAEDLDLEREVVLEEIAMVDDTPDDLVFELHGERLWAGHPYGHRILGTPDTVRAITADDLRALHAEAYVGRRMIVCVAGHLDPDDVLARVRQLFGDVPAGCEATPVPPAPRLVPGSERVSRPTQQCHVVIGTLGVPHGDVRRLPLVLLATALGGGMSSRLFQQVREKLGLAYAVHTVQSFYRRAGFTGIYLGTRPESEGRAVQAALDELRRAAEHGLPADELARVREQVKGEVILGMESTSGRLHRLAHYALHEEPYRTLDQVLERVDAVDADAVVAAAAEFLPPERQVALSLGP